MAEENWEKYQCSYSLDGAGWGVQVVAKSFEDAQRRLRAIGMTGQVGGPIALEVHIPERGWIARLLTRVFGNVG